MSAAASPSACWHRWASVKGGREDVHLLPLHLLSSSGPGGFLEIGAHDGVTGSQSRLLEECYGWTGLLVEANPSNYEKLKRAPRLAHKVNVAIGNCSEGKALMTETASSSAALANVPVGHGFSAMFDRRVEVPCRRSLLELWREHYPDTRLNFLSLECEIHPCRCPSAPRIPSPQPQRLC